MSQQATKRRQFLASLIAISTCSVAANAQIPSAPFEGRWIGKGNHGEVDLTVAQGGAVKLLSAGRPVDLQAPVYADGKLTLKTSGGGLVIAIVREGSVLKASNHALTNIQSGTSS